jgi:hypothetical protein
LEAAFVGLLLHFHLQLAHDGQFLLVGGLTSLQDADHHHFPVATYWTGVLTFLRFDPRRHVLHKVIGEQLLPLITDEADPAALVVVVEVEGQVARLFVPQEAVAVKDSLHVAVVVVADEQFPLLLNGQDGVHLHLPRVLIEVVHDVGLLGGPARVVEHVQQRDQPE